MVWINKLPFAPFADPVIAARRALVAEEAEDTGAEDPDQVASETYYLPLAAISLRQAVGRLIRTSAHRGVVIISDRKLSGPTRLRQSYRRIFLGSLDSGMLKDDPDTGECGGGNVVTMAEGWERIWSFLARGGAIDERQLTELCTAEALEIETLLPRPAPSVHWPWTPRPSAGFAPRVARCSRPSSWIGAARSGASCGETRSLSI